MKIMLIVAVLLIMLLPLTNLAQRSMPRRTGTIEGVIVDINDGPHEIALTVESGGSKYEFCLACRGSDKDSPRVIGGDVKAVGTRVRVSYVNLTRSRDGSTYYIKALRIIRLRKK